MKKLYFFSFVIVLSVNAAQGPVFPPGGPAVFNEPVRLVEPVMPVVVQIPAPAEPEPNYYDIARRNLATSEAKALDLIRDTQREFSERFKHLTLADKNALEKYLRAYIVSASKAFVLQTSADVDYETVKSTFGYVFEEKQKQLAEVIKSAPNIYPLIQKISQATSKIVALVPGKVPVRYSESIVNPKKTFEYLKKLYVALHINLMLAISYDLLNIGDFTLFDNFLTWYVKNKFYYFHNDEVFKRLLGYFSKQKMRYVEALERNKIAASSKVNLEGATSRDFERQISDSLDQQVSAATSGAYTNAISMAWADEQGKLEAKKKVWQAKYQFYDKYERILRSMLNSHHIPSKL